MQDHRTDRLKKQRLENGAAYTTRRRAVKGGSIFLSVGQVMCS